MGRRAGYYQGVRAILLALAGACILAACDPTGSANQAPPPPPPSPSGTPSSTALPAPALIARDTDNGHTIQLKAGQVLTVVLASTYWTFGPASTPAVLRPAVAPVVSPQQAGCAVGGGCGTVTASFEAVAAGKAQITASRISCGETGACTGTAGSYQLVVVVSP